MLPAGYGLASAALAWEAVAAPHVKKKKAARPKRRLRK